MPGFTERPIHRRDDAVRRDFPAAFVLPRGAGVAGTPLPVTAIKGMGRIVPATVTDVPVDDPFTILFELRVGFAES